MPRMIHPSIRCAALCAVLALFVTRNAVAQTGAELLIRPFEKDQSFELNGSARIQDEGEDDFGGEMQVSVFEVSGRAREVREKTIPRVGYDLVYIDVDNDLGIPEHLSDQSIAAGVALPDISGFRGGFTFGIGYAGDSPYSDANAWYGKATIAMGKQLDEETDLGIFLDYDGNRTYLPDVPLPGFAYRKRVDDKLILVAGAPLSTIEWKPDERWKFELFWTLIDSFDARVTYTVAPGFNVFGSVDSRRYAFHTDELESSNDRLLFKERRAEVGVQWEPRKDTRIIFAGGYAFDQEFGTGWDYRDDDEITELSDEPYVRAGLEMRF